jgi:hypothetical protein
MTEQELGFLGALNKGPERERERERENIKPINTKRLQTGKQESNPSEDMMQTDQHPLGHPAKSGPFMDTNGFQVNRVGSCVPPPPILTSW